MRKEWTPLLVIVACWLAGCAVNAVTGEKQLAILPESYEITLGKTQYAPSRQMYGGDYRIDEELSAYINEVGQRLAAVSDRALPYEFVVLNNGTPNAWALPGGKIAINRGLLVELKSEAELAAVLAHEIVHAAARHGAQRLERGALFQGLLLAVSIASGGSDFSALAVGTAAVGAELIGQCYSREAELEADHYGIIYMARAGYNPNAAVDLQEMFVRLAGDKRPDWLSGLFASHPPSQERVEHNRATVAKLGPLKGEVGLERYQKKIAHLLELKPAYDAYEKGRKALQGGDAATAQKLATQALEAEPREALFLSLLGDALVERGETRRALDLYSRVVALDPDYFRHYYQRGRLRAELNDRQQARGDFEKSLALLPTADANFALGKLAMESGDHREAIELFEEAAKARTPSGKAALEMLHRLDMPRRPDRYLKASLERKSKCIRVIIQNPTTVAVWNVDLLIKKSRKRRFRLNIPQTIDPGERLKIQTDVALAKEKDLYKWDVIIESANLAE